MAAFCPELKRCYLVPIEVLAGRTFLHLRLTPARNNQRGGVRMAAEFELGAVVQLEERLHGMQEATGSSPVSSTLRQAVPQGGLFGG